MREKLKKNITETFGKLNEVLSSFSETETNIANIKGSWTAGQIAEHLIKSLSGMPQLFKGNTEKALRVKDEKIAKIKAMFLDFTLKMETRDFLQPSNKHHNKEEILSSFQNIKDEILEIAKTHDLELICLDFEIPTFGKFTKYEWIWFCLFHIQRHIYQLENLKIN